MIETKEIVNILSEEMSEFEGKVIFSDMYKDNNVQLGQLPPLTLTSFTKKWGLVTIR